jgi:Zn-dependent protease with chaperone function
MNFIIQHLNDLGAKMVAFAWPMLWQSSLLIGLMLLVEWGFGRKPRPGVRYGLWLVVLAKLILPPSLALPTGIAWWVRPHVVAQRPARDVRVFVTYGPLPSAPAVPVEPAMMPASPNAELSAAGAAFAASAAMTVSLFTFMLWRWRQVGRQAAAPANEQTPAWLADLLGEARRCAGVRRSVGLRFMEGPVSPALFGLFRPLILLPEPLVERLSRTQLRAVLLHELMHWRPGDVWVNCAQALVQVAYWWHPLVWVANSRIRRVREEAVDDAVMMALRNEAEDYAPTLVEVARLALHRPLASLGLIGILESHGALRQRIERLLDFHPPRRAGLTTVSSICALAFGALALPMGPADDRATGDARSTEPDSPQISPTDLPGNERTPDTKALVQDGKLLFEMGKLDEAEKKLLEALRQNPRNQAAYYYMNLVKEARYKQQGQGRSRTLNSGRQSIYGELDKTRIDKVEFDNVSLEDALNMLTDEARRNDPEKVGVNLILSQAASSNNQDIGRVKIRIVPSIVNVRLADVLDAIVKVADRPIKYSIEDYGIVFSFKNNEPPPLYVRMIKSIRTPSKTACIR